MWRDHAPVVVEMAGLAALLHWWPWATTLTEYGWAHIRLLKEQVRLGVVQDSE